MKPTNVNRIFVAISIVIVAFSIVNHVGQVEDIASPRSVIHDRRFIAAMNNISAQVPADNVLVVSTNAPFVTYFTGHIARVPFGVTSKKALVDYMRRNHYDYLVVFEGGSQVRELKSLFSPKGVQSLTEDFQCIGSFQTDFSKILLYKIKDST